MIGQKFMWELVILPSGDLPLGKGFLAFIVIERQMLLSGDWSLGKGFVAFIFVKHQYVV